MREPWQSLKSPVFGTAISTENGVLVMPDGDYYRFSALVGGGFARTLRHIGATYGGISPAVLVDQ